MTDELKERRVREYIELLLRPGFEVSMQDQITTFSDGKKVADTFVLLQKEIIDFLFVNDENKSKVCYYVARSKILDFLAKSSLKKIDSSVSALLKYLKENKEETFRMVSMDMAESVKLKAEDAFRHYMEYFNYNSESRYSKSTYVNASAKDYAESIEKAIKATIIFNDAKRNEKYYFTPDEKSELDENRRKKDKEKRLIAGSSLWRKTIGDKTSPITKEVTLLELIKEGLDASDPRFFLTEDDLKVNSGHGLYALYKLLDPVTKAIVNSEFYIYDLESPYNIRKPVGMVAVLNDDIAYDKAGTKEQDEHFNESNDAFTRARYAEMNLENVTEDELDFLKRLGTAMEAYCDFKFPDTKKYDQIKFDYVKINEMENKYSIFSKLDLVSKHYLCSYFTEEEINALNDFYTVLTLSDLEKDCFLNLAIFFKYYLVVKKKMNLEFNSVVFNHLIIYYDSIKDFDLFNGVSENIFANSFFTTENIERIQSEIKEAQKKQRKFKVSPDIIHITEARILEKVHKNMESKFKSDKKGLEDFREELENNPSDYPIELGDFIDCISRRLKTSLIPEDETFILNKIRNSLIHNREINTSAILMYTQLINPDKEVLEALKKLLNNNIGYGPDDSGNENLGKTR